MGHLNKRIKPRAAVVAALSVGAVVSGCAPQAPGDALGSICAAPSEGGEFCVPANQSPAGAPRPCATEGVDVALLDAVQAKLKAGDVKGAALVYDAAVRSTEGT